MVAAHEVAIEHCYARTNCSWPPQNHCGTIACALSLGWLHSNLDYNVLAVGLKQVKPLNLYEKAFACWEGHPRNRCKETVNLSYCFISRPTKRIRSINPMGIFLKVNSTINTALLLFVGLEMKQYDKSRTATPI